MFKITPIHHNMTFLSAGEMLEPGLLLLLGHSVTVLWADGYSKQHGRAASRALWSPLIMRNLWLGS